MRGQGLTGCVESTLGGAWRNPPGAPERHEAFTRDP